MLNRVADLNGKVWDRRKIYENF